MHYAQRTWERKSDLLLGCNLSGITYYYVKTYAYAINSHVLTRTDPCFNKGNSCAMNIIELPHDKTNKMTVRPVKTQISLGICPVWSESSLCSQWVAKDLSFLHADNKDSDQTGSLACPGSSESSLDAQIILLVLSWGGSYGLWY